MKRPTGSLGRTRQQDGETAEPGPGDPPAADISERFQDAYANDPERIARVRRSVLTKYDEALLTAGRARRRRLRQTLAFVFGTTLALGLVGLGASANSGPGQPFYGARLEIERLTLPASGEARWQAELAHLDARRADIRSTAVQGDAASFTAAVTAYQANMADLLDLVGAPGVNTPELQASLSRAATSLNDLAGTLSGASAARVQAIAGPLVEEIRLMAGPGGKNDGNGNSATGTPGPGTSAGSSDGPTQGHGPSTRPGSGNGNGHGPTSSPGPGNGNGNAGGNGNGNAVGKGNGNGHGPTTSPGPGNGNGTGNGNGHGNKGK